MRHATPLAVVATLVALCSPAAAQGIRVLVEPLNPPPASPAAPGDTPAKASPVFLGTLLKPTMVVLSSGDPKSAGTVLDLTNKVFVISFPTEAINALDQDIADAKKQFARADLDDKCKAVLAANIVKLGTTKATLQIGGTHATTLYKSGVFKGYFDETKEKVKFLIQKDETSPSAGTDPPTEYTPDQLKAIYFFPTPPATPATPAPPKTGQLAPAGRGNADLTGTWAALSQNAEELKQQRALVAEKFSQVNREYEAIKFTSDWDWDAHSHPASRSETLERLGAVREALRESARAKDAMIEHLEIVTAHLPRPLPEYQPEPYEAFYSRPCVKVVPVCDKPSQPVSKIADKNPFGSLEQRVARTQTPPFQKRFEQPAHFPMPRSGACGERIDLDGVVIYEGMRFVATRDGQYEVSFSTTTPKMAVTLRLQLVFAGPEGCAFTLTLPPVMIDPAKTFVGNYTGESFQVYHAGYSPLVARHFADLGCVTVARQGTARFGSWPETINRYEQLTTAPAIAQTSYTAQAGDTADSGAADSP